MKFLIITLSLVTLSLSASAEWDISYKGELRLETRAFESDQNEDTYDQNYSFFARREVSIINEDTGWLIKAGAHVRRAFRDDERSLVAIEDAYVEKDFGELQLFGGFRIINWSTAEAFHPSDIVNARNFDTQFENAEKFGELMFGFSKQWDDYGLQAFYMPHLQKPFFTSGQSRVSFVPPGVTVEDSEFVDEDGRKAKDFESQWAIKATMNKWSGDWSLYWVHHYDRMQPAFSFGSTGSGALNATPIFAKLDQYGLNVQQQLGDFIVKFEGARREYQNEQISSSEFPFATPLPLATPLTFISHTVIAGGLEYTHGWDSGSETTFLSEAQFIDGATRAERRVVNLFQRDLLLGFRHSFNDAASREIMFIAIADLEISKQLLISLNYSQRIKDVWKIKIGGRYIDAPDETGPLELARDLRIFDGDNQVYIEFSRFF